MFVIKNEKELSHYYRLSAYMNAAFMGLSALGIVITHWQKQDSTYLLDNEIVLSLWMSGAGLLTGYHAYQSKYTNGFGATLPTSHDKNPVWLLGLGLGSLVSGIIFATTARFMKGEPEIYGFAAIYTCALLVAAHAAWLKWQHVKLGNDTNRNSPTFKLI
jgi:hypothetical protein